MSDRIVLAKDRRCVTPDKLALWIPPDRALSLVRAGGTLPEILERQSRPLLQRLQRDLDAKNSAGRRVDPDMPSLALSLVTLAAAGMDLSPMAQECTVLGFVNKKGEMVYSPVIQRQGLRRVIGDEWDVRQFKTQVVLDGDTFEHWWDDEGEHVRWRAGATRASVVVQGALNYAGIQGGFTLVELRAGRPLLAVLDAAELHEKLRANRNVAPKRNKRGEEYRSGAWEDHPLEMLKKTIEKYALRQIARDGRAVGVVALDGLAEARRLPELAQHLRDVGADRGLPQAATDVLDFAPGSLALEHDEGADDLDDIMQGDNR